LRMFGNKTMDKRLKIMICDVIQDFLLKVRKWSYKSFTLPVISSIP
jgi:hypothetical protein